MPTVKSVLQKYHEGQNIFRREAVACLVEHIEQLEARAPVLSEKQQPETVEVLTKVYAFVNRIKICLSIKDVAGVWRAVNELSNYLVSVDCDPMQRSDNNCPACNGTRHLRNVE